MSTGKRKAKHDLHPIRRYSWFDSIHKPHWLLFLMTHGPGILGPIFVGCRWKTLLFAISYAYLLGFGITAGYHRLWSHRSFNASLPLQYFLAILGAGACQHDIEWWCYRHRVHHRYTDTELDPYSAPQGLFHSHVGWLLYLPRHEMGVADISDLKKDAVVQWQCRNYALLALLVSVIVPGIIPYLCWGETIGGCAVYAVAFRMCYLYHATFSVNSLAHWLGETTFDDKNTPRDHFLTALITLGEGYHNFHHEFPMDYRNAIQWYQYDPTKWFIWVCQKLGLASNLKVFSENEVRKSRLTMQLKKLKGMQDCVTWPPSTNDLPVIDWKTFEAEASKRPLIVIAGFVHDVSDFINEHPGGPNFLTQNVGKDATAAFFGGVYNHSNAAHNLLAMKRVGILHGGVHPGLEKSTPPSQHLRIVRYDEVVHTTGGS